MNDAWIFTHPEQWARTEAPAYLDTEKPDAYMARLGYRLHSRVRNGDLIEFVGSWVLYTATAPVAALTGSAN